METSNNFCHVQQTLLVSRVLLIRGKIIVLIFVYCGVVPMLFRCCVYAHEVTPIPVCSPVSAA